MLITINNQYCWLGKAPACDIEELDILLRELETRWLLQDCDTAAMLEAPYSQLVCRVLQVLPTKPGLSITLQLLQADIVSFEELFFRSDAGPSLISAHHKFEPKLKRLEVKPGEPITAQHLPFPSCGNAADDQLASLLNSFGPETFQWVWANLSLDRIDRISSVLKDLQIPENDRILAYTADVALGQNPDAFSLDEAEQAFADVEAFINTGELKNGWKSSRQQP